MSTLERMLMYKKVCGYFDLHQGNFKWRESLKELEKFGYTFTKNRVTIGYLGEEELIKFIEAKNL